ncbi:MAG TPA: PqqD family protein [Thermoleophilaceae bacterium]|nr:PqqD family protein [Thermoleophilaceae bacterium]
MDVNSRPRRREDVLAQAAGDTVILLTPDSGEYFTLNEVGGRIWELADGSRSVAEIAAALADEYEAPLKEIQVDTLDVLAELAEERLVSDGAAGS